MPFQEAFLLLEGKGRIPLQIQKTENTLWGRAHSLIKKNTSSNMLVWETAKRKQIRKKERKKEKGVHRRLDTMGKMPCPRKDQRRQGVGRKTKGARKQTLDRGNF